MLQSSDIVTSHVHTISGTDRIVLMKQDYAKGAAYWIKYLNTLDIVVKSMTEDTSDGNLFLSLNMLDANKASRLVKIDIATNDVRTIYTSDIYNSDASMELHT